MHQDFLESAEFYQHRYHNFSSRVIIPTAGLFLFVLLFGLFATKEITLSASASLEPNRVIANIQSTSNNTITTNHLAENKVVKKGELLVQYQNTSEQAQEANYTSQLDMLQDQKKQLEFLQASLQAGSDQFPAPDNFGYQQNFQDYLNQATSLRSNTDQQNASIASQNASASNTQAEIGNLMAETQAKIADYQAVKSAIQNGTSVDSSNTAYSTFQAYQAQENLDPQVQSQTLVQIDGQIAQLESALAGYRVQYAGAGTQQAYSTSLSSQLESLKAQQLAKVGQDMSLLDQKILEAQTGKEVQTNLVEKGNITAPEDGILHLNPETKQASMVAEGGLLAQLYPLLTSEKKLKITAYIPSKDISQVKVGLPIRFTTVDELNKQQHLTSTITSIDTTASKTEQGNFFKIEAETRLTNQQARTLPYGLEGRMFLITGKKTYFNYYKDRFFKQE